MAEEGISDPPKVIEPPQCEPKITSKTVESSSPVNQPVAPKKSTVSTAKADKRLNEKILLFAGIPATVVIAIFIQYLYHNFYVIPLRERTLLNVVNMDAGQAPWVAHIDGSKFTLFHHSGLDVTFQYLNPDDSSNNFVWNKGNSHFGKVANSEAFFELKYLISDLGWEVSILQTNGAAAKANFSFGTNQPGQMKNGVMHLGAYRIHGLPQQDSVNMIQLEQGQEMLISAVGSEETPDASSFLERFQSVEERYDVQFDAIFQLKAKSMPEFYQNMGESALSLVLSSLYTEERIFEATGDYNSWFQTEKLPFTHLHLPDGCEDLRTQGLAALSVVDLNPNGVLQVISSWTNLVNTYGRMPTNVSGILDYRTKMAPVLFVILDEYIYKNGILEMKQIYKNIEIVGLTLLELLNSGKLFVATKESYFFDKIEDTEEEVYSVELLGMVVKASRVLQRLSAEYGDVEMAKKFFDFNGAVDNLDTLKQYQTNEGVFKDFIMKTKDGQQVKEFVSDTDSIAPFVFQQLPPVSEEIEMILSKLSSATSLWTNYGVRSSKGISVAHNFMILKSLSYYSHLSSPNQEAAHALYAQLRNHLIMFVAKEFKKSKTFWEYYSDSDGHGFGRRDWLPSATILKIMAELY